MSANAYNTIRFCQLGKLAQFAKMSPSAQGNQGLMSVLRLNFFLLATFWLNELGLI